MGMKQLILGVDPTAPLVHFSGRGMLIFLMLLLISTFPHSRGAASLAFYIPETCTILMGCFDHILGAPLSKQLLAEKLIGSVNTANSSNNKSRGFLLIHWQLSPGHKGEGWRKMGEAGAV